MIAPTEEDETALESPSRDSEYLAQAIGMPRPRRARGGLDACTMQAIYGEQLKKPEARSVSKRSGKIGDWSLP